MENPGRKHLIRLPRTVLVGEEILYELSNILKDYGFSKILIIAGPKTWEIAGKAIKTLLNSKKAKIRKYIAERATRKEANQAIDQNRKRDIEVVMGVGGGKNIDIAKVVARELSCSMISVPTSLSHDGLASPFASLKKREQKFSEYGLSPLAVLVDLGKIKSAPKRLIKSGVGDILSNLNAVLDWELAHDDQGEYYGGYASSLSKMAAEIVLNSKDGLINMTLEGIRTLSEAIISSGIAMGIAGSSRPASGAEHLFSHALDSIDEELALHGEQCGVGTIIMLHHRGDKRWKNVKNLLKKIGAPTTAKELGISHKILVKALVKAPKIRDRYTILDQKPLNESQARQLLSKTGVIS